MRSSKTTITRTRGQLGVLTLALLVAPSPSIAAPKPAPQPSHDSVAFIGIGDPQGTVLWQIEIDARSGPSGEGASGQVTIDNERGTVLFNGPVTCLAVRGNVATFNVQTPQFGVITMETTDQSPSGPQEIINAAPTGRAPGDCSPFPFGLLFLVRSGDVRVVDAQPRPTSKEQCKDGGWAQFGFKNQGQCVASVQHGPKP
jgi:hypothetical protein